jgi:hypothetical protein
MTVPLYVQAAHHHILPARRARLKPRDRFVEYQRDLHRIAGQQLDPQSLVMGDQYTYVELADALLERVGPHVLPGLEVLVTSYWTPEFDPEFSAFGPYLHHKWSLECQSFDVTDQGSIAPMLALSILGDFLRSEADAAEGLLLAVEQSTTPQAIDAHLSVPGASSAGVIRLTGSPERASAELLASRYLNEAHVLAPDFRLQHVLADWSDALQLPRDGLNLVVRRNTYLYRNLRYWADCGLDIGYHVRFVAPHSSCMNVFAWLAQLLSDHGQAAGTYVFVDEDVESLAAAATIVRKF